MTMFNCCECGKRWDGHNGEFIGKWFEDNLTFIGDVYCEDCWGKFSKDQKYYRRHKIKVKNKSKKKGKQ